MLVCHSRPIFDANLPLYWNESANTQAEVKTEDDLIPQGAQSGTIATDLEQAIGLERLEILGKMEGIDIFDMRPLDSSRTGKKTSSDTHPAILGHVQGESEEIGS